jgi:phosphate-selective porin OprO/OprP
MKGRSFVWMLALALAAPAWAFAQDEAQPEEPKPQDESPFRFYFKNGIFFESDDGNFKGQIGGRIQHDSIYQRADDEVEASAGDPVDESKFRRARMFVKGLINERFEFKVEGDFARGGSFADIYLKLKDFPLSDTTFGHFKEPIGLEQLMDAGDLLFMERSLANALVPGRNFGIMVNGTFADGNGTYAVGLFRTADEFGHTSDPAGPATGEGDGAGSARLTYILLYEEATNLLLHIGAAVSRRSDNEVGLTFDVDFGLDSDNFSVEAGTATPLVPESITILAFEALFMMDSFLALFEYTRMAVKNDLGDDPVFTAYALTISWILTGERRPYLRQTGTLGGVRPRRNAFGKDADGIGAFELVLRADRVDILDSALSSLFGGAEIGTIMIGLNWYANGHVKVMINLGVFTFDDGTADGDGSEAGLRVEFAF